MPIGTVGGGKGNSAAAAFEAAMRAAEGALSRSWNGSNGSGDGTGGPGFSKADGSSAALETLIRNAAQRVGVDEQLVKAVVEAESNFNPRAVSSAGAKGLMQLMDGTARALGVKDPFDPAANLEGGARYLRAMLDRFQSLPMALAAYNAGPGAVETYGGIPPYRETVAYVDRVLQLMRRNQYEAAAGKRRDG